MSVHETDTRNIYTKHIHDTLNQRVFEYLSACPLNLSINAAHNVFAEVE